MRRFARPIVVVGVMLFAPTLASAQGPASNDLAKKIDQIFARFGPTSPGCAVGLAKDGQTLYTHGYGSANLEYGVPLTDSTVLESGSVAKQFTASAILALVADGKLKLTDDIRRYLPEVPEFGGQKITIQNLLTHTSGLRDQWGLLGIEGRGPGTQVHTLMTTLDLVAHQKMLNFPPGSAYLYSNTGYALAALIVQRVSGKSLDAFMQERYFRPLGMTHTQWRDDFTEVVRNRATAYSGSDATGFHQDMPFTNMIGNGGLLSTVGDLMKWNENLDRGTIGGRSYLDAIQTQMRLNNGRTLSYALGLTVNSYNGAREVSHDGSTAGYRTYLARFPEQHVSIAVWCNNASAGPGALGHQVADLVLSKGTIAAGGPSAEKVELPAAALEQWAGTYRDVFSDQTLTLTASNGTLRSPESGGGRGNQTVLVPVGGLRFRGSAGIATFSTVGGKRMFALPRADGDTSHYEEVRLPPSPVRLRDYVGTYASDELDVRFTIAERDGKLFLQRRPSEEFELRPSYEDDFRSGGGLGTLRFARDTKGAINGFSFYAGRVVDVRFRRIP
jgi:CubicO group peptidase (beta-lactamase class C family)